ncbi:hypothetical protein MTBBW1_440016 [Desulfamplus magnetovallimortis]|uniref:Uncharacterized protein n=1 Tax=Desulfamplus magnetovallimortis TaxID=1246637 RepID=A0A1W1HH25_9BACT|nr:hypothetical protein [Desulfamplus magnetovallimortis]SLM31811.1 hypothetical protein MTBBW1_440016 [Desulfamplus magnetovallimortis]
MRIFNGWCPKYVDELFTNLDSAGLSQKEINTFMTLPFNDFNLSLAVKPLRQ